MNSYLVGANGINDSADNIFRVKDWHQQWMSKKKGDGEREGGGGRETSGREGKTYS